MAEHDIRVFGNVFIQPLPDFFVIPNFMAVHANRQNSLQLFYMGDGFFKLPDPAVQFKLQPRNPFPHFNAGLEFIFVKAFDNKIIRSGV